MKKHPLILIDGSSWLFRAFHVLPPLTTQSGQPTGAIHGMCNMLQKFLAEYDSNRIVVVFDAPGKTFRNDIFAEYKANRPPTPEDLSAQFDGLYAIIKAMGLPLIQQPGVEADDVLGTLATQAEGDVLIVTSDKDMAQLVTEHVHLLDTMKNKRTDIAAVHEKFDVAPEQIIDYLALMGDKSDNIPGVPKVGKKTAAKWLNKYGSLDAIIEHADDIGGKVGENLCAEIPNLPMYKDLATIRCDVDLGSLAEDLERRPADNEALADLYREFELNRHLKELETAIERPAVAVPETTDSHYQTVLAKADFNAMLAKLKAADLICLDTETDSLSATQSGLVGLSFAVQASEAWYVPLAHNYAGAPKQLDFDWVVGQLKPVLEDANKSKVGQNLKYDINVLRRHGINLAGADHDTMLASYVLDSTATRHDMDSLAWKYLNRETTPFEAVAGKGKKAKTFNQIELETAGYYAAEDADITLQLHQALYPALQQSQSLLDLYHQVEMPLMPILADMEAYGVAVDVEQLQQLSEVARQRQDVIEEMAYAAAGEAFNLGSPAQLKTVLFDNLGLPVIRKTPKGAPSTAEDVLHELASHHELPALVLEWRELSKLRSTYTERLPEQVNPLTGRIHTSYHQAVAATGRLSSSHPNLQNIPVRSEMGRKIRQAFIAPEGYQLVAIDYSQIELRIMAHLSGDPVLVAAFKQGQDIHSATAAEVFGVALEDVTSEQRRQAKAINFGLMYGMSAFGLAKQIGTSRAQAQDYIDTFFARLAGVHEFMEQTRVQAHDQGYVETLFGRRLYLPEINARNGRRRAATERTAINAPLQGTAADLIKKAMVDVAQWLQETGEPARMLMQVHDELIFEIPTSEAERLAAAIKQHMCEVISLDIPLLADTEIGQNWG